MAGASSLTALQPGCKRPDIADSALTSLLLPQCLGQWHPVRDHSAYTSLTRPEFRPPASRCASLGQTVSCSRFSENLVPRDDVPLCSSTGGLSAAAVQQSEPYAPAEGSCAGLCAPNKALSPLATSTQATPCGVRHEAVPCAGRDSCITATLHFVHHVHPVSPCSLTSFIKTSRATCSVCSVCRGFSSEQTCTRR